MAVFLFNCTDERTRVTAVNGVFDLSQWNFEGQERDSTVQLDGEWEFYWNSFLFPNGLSDAASYIKVPSQWQDEKILLDKKEFTPPGKGYATYRLKIILPQKTPPLSIIIPTAGSAYRVYINRELYFSFGNPGTKKEESVPFSRKKDFAVSLPNDRVLDLVIHISNFHDTSGGLWDNFILGTSKAVSEKQKYVFAVDLIVFGSLLVMGLYHLGLYLNRRKDSSPLYFGIFCLLIAVRTVTVNERLILDFIPKMSFLLMHKVEFFSFYFSAFIFLLFIQRLFPEESSKKMFMIMTFIFIPPSLSVIIFPMNIYTEFLGIVRISILIGIIYVMKISVQSLMGKKQGAVLFTAGLLIFFVSVVNDILKTSGYLSTPLMASYGFLSFVFFQAVLLSSRFAKAFVDAEQLTEELRLLSAELERKVEVRTLDLQNAKSETDTLNEIAVKVNSNLDIGSIINVILKHIQEKYDINICFVFMLDSVRERISVFSSSVPAAAGRRMIRLVSNLSINLNEDLDIHKYVLDSRKALYLKEVRKTGARIENFFKIRLKIKSFICIPLVLKDEVIGFLDFSRMGRQISVSEADFAYLQILANQAAGAIRNASLMKEREEAVRSAEIEKGIALIAQREAEIERMKSERLILNILPEKTAQELKEKGYTDPVFIESAAVMFTDFQGFTEISELLSPQDLIQGLDFYFSAFDQIIQKHNLEKLKTVGDSYMCAGGVPRINAAHAVDSVLAALEIQSFMNENSADRHNGSVKWKLRIGIHSGPVIAGVVGEKKFAYDVWGDTVNTASRMESSGEENRINISGAVYGKVKDFFDCRYRGRISAKNKGEIDMYFVEGIRKELADPLFPEKTVPNEGFMNLYNNL
ncbi:MAG TPA: adenylate/guanylate cyclase domain-containing protein [Leptospiraceae bacterium]|nr:adenylate/guanylate cyclase domain-containing protein [Leptospiraceae bacterium]HNO22629.1 adenylate/guanylate cyclase domain-containing protein [Leptospiraceae bacterium]